MRKRGKEEQIERGHVLPLVYVEESERVAQEMGFCIDNTGLENV